NGEQVEPSELRRRQPAARDLRLHPRDRHARGSARHPGRASENSCVRPGSLGKHPGRWAKGGGGLGRSRTRYLVDELGTRTKEGGSMEKCNGRECLKDWID